MEQQLKNLLGLAGSNKAQANLATVLQGSIEMVCREDGTVAPHILRAKCLAAVQAALVTKQAKICQTACDALQAMVRDDRFAREITTASENETCAMQVLQTVGTALPTCKSQHQCRLLTIVVEMMCNERGRASVAAVNAALELCMQAYGSAEETSVRLASRAAASQIMTSFCATPSAFQDESAQGRIAIYMDSTSVLGSTIKKCTSLGQLPYSEHTVILLDAIYSILSAQSSAIRTHQPFINVIWQELCPCLMKLVGEPSSKGPREVSNIPDEPMGRGQSAVVALNKSIFEYAEVARSLYQILEQLLRLLAPISAMRTVLEAVFHRALLYPKVEQRAEALRLVRKVVSSDERVVDLLSISVDAKSLTLWKIFLDCLFECSQCNNMEICVEALRSIEAFLSCLSRICTEEGSDLWPKELVLAACELLPSTKASLVTAFAYKIDEGVKRGVILETDSIEEEHSMGEDLERNCAKTAGSSNGEEQGDKEEEANDELSERLKCLANKLESRGENVGDTVEGDILDEDSCKEEEETAKCFVGELETRLPSWMQLKSTIEVDEALQTFASTFFSEFTHAQKSAFESRGRTQSQFLNSDAIYLCSYASLAVSIRMHTHTDMDTKWLTNEVLRSGCVVYASDRWLAAVFKELVKRDIMAKWGPSLSAPLVDVVKDYDGRDHQIMSDVRRIQKVAGSRSDTCVAARRLSRWVLTASWDALVGSISRFVTSSPQKQRSLLRPKLVDAIDYALHAVHALAYISVTLGVGNRSGWLFERLVEMSCPVEELREVSTKEKNNSCSDRLTKWPLRKVDALSMQIVLDSALQCALHAKKCWKHVIRCTEYIWEVEKYLFGTTSQEQNNRWSLWKKKSGKVQKEAESCCEQQSVEDVLNGDTSDVLSSHLAARVLCVLIAKTDSLYESVGKKLNLSSLCELMRTLVSASESRLQFSNHRGVALTDPASLMHRIAFIMLRLHPRPLIHLMKVWPTITTHFIQCACAREDEQLTRASIGCLNDCVSGLLIAESNGFCFNQMLFRPFQDILCGDMCSEESQDQIVSLLASFVHARPDEIGSGWRPLFGALRALRTSPLNESDPVNSGISSVQATVLDVFSTYLNIGNANVLTATLLDYVTCVLHYLQATESNFVASCQDLEVASTALECLLKVEGMVHKLVDRADSVVPHLLHRLLLRERACESIDASVEPSYVVSPLSSILLDDPLFDCTKHPPLPTELDRVLQPSAQPVPWASLGTVSRSCIEIHLSLLEGLTAVAITCPTSLQSKLLHTIADIISKLIPSKFGIDYGAYSLSSLIFPALQQWIRRESVENEVNLKQAVGLFTEVAVTYLNTSEESAWVDRLCLESLSVLTECAARSSERVARLGCACIRHLIKSTAHSYTRTRWTIVVRSLWNAIGMTLAYIRLLMTCYMVDSKDPNGDVGCVRVVLREDSPTSHQTLLLAQQVFLLENQLLDGRRAIEEPSEQNELNRELVMSEEGAEDNRITVHQLVVSLLSHQLIVQLVGCVLLQNVDLETSGTAQVILNKINHSSQDQNRYLDKLSTEDVTTLFHCLDASIQTSRHFESRPGLKLLLQSIFKFPAAPNLCKQATLAWTLRCLTMYELVRSSDLDEKAISDALAGEKSEKFTASLVKQLATCHATVCSQLCTMEHSLAMDKIGHLTRAHVDQQFSLVLDDSALEENGEKLYKVVSSQDSDAFLSNYKKSKNMRSLNTRRRPNPFEEGAKPEEDTERQFHLNDGDIRCVTWAEMSLVPLVALLSEEEHDFRRLLPILYRNIAVLMKDCADIRVRAQLSKLAFKLPAIFGMFPFEMVQRNTTMESDKH